MSGEPVLLSGGNPQIAKGEGGEVVQRYIGERLDAIIGREVAGVRKAVKWNSPFYGAPDGPPQTWFASFHCFTNYVKVTFFRGASLDPMPKGKSKHPDVRYYDVREGALDEAQFAAWVKQASRLPGEKM